MTVWIADWYAWIKALHVIAVIAWMAGMLYLPRLFVYHADAPVGSALSIFGLAALLFAIIEAPSAGWLSGQTLAAFAVAAVVLAVFVAWELRVSEPMLDVRFFENPRFSAASISITLVFFALMGTMFYLTQHLQLVQGHSTFAAGIRLVPVALAFGFAGPIAAVLFPGAAGRRPPNARPSGSVAPDAERHVIDR